MFDLLTIGRVSMDLFARNIGADFTDFESSVGGSPTNIAMGSSRLGLEVAALTAVGDDEVGRFVRHTLDGEGVQTRYIPTKPNTRTGLALVGVQPPDKFPLVFYRENVADVQLTIDDLLSVPLADFRALLLSGTALSRGTGRDATLFAAQEAERLNLTTFIDLDLRPDQWSHPRAYGLNIRTVLPFTQVIIGTEEEFFAALSHQPETVMAGQSLSSAQHSELASLLSDLRHRLAHNPTFVVKRGARGVSIYRENDQQLQISGFPVEILNTVGAGDAFASGLIYGYLQGWPWSEIARFANACGAIVVTRHGCSKAMPYLEEVREFLERQGVTSKE